MSEHTAQEIVRRYHRAWTSGEIDEAMSLVAEDIFCRAPGIDLEGRAAYREFIGGFAPSLTGITDIAEFTSADPTATDDRVALFYYPETASTTTAPAAELFTLRDGRICESILIFDRLSYGPPEQG